MSSIARPDIDRADQPQVKSKKRHMRPWLFFSLLALLVIVLSAPQRLRQSEAESSEFFIMSLLTSIKSLK